MKNSKLFYGFALLFLAGVVLYIGSMVSNNMGFHWGKNQVGLSSNEIPMLQDSVAIPEVVSLSSEGNCDVEIIASDENRVVFYYDKEYYNNLSKVEGKELNIDFESKKHITFGWNNAPGIQVKVYSKSLMSISQNGVGDMSSKDTLVGNTLALDNEGIGSMQFAVLVNTIDISNGGLGSIEVSGSACQADIKNEGTGSIDAIHLMNKIAKVSNSGVGSVDVNATETLDLSNSGVGNITYTGTAVIKNMHSDGVGTISKQ